MARPQQPELARSRKTEGLEQDAVGSDLEAEKGAKAKGKTGPVPEDNLPGHHPEHEQDKPDLDAFAAKFAGHTDTDTDTKAGTDEDSADVDSGDVAKTAAPVAAAPVTSAPAAPPRVTEATAPGTPSSNGGQKSFERRVLDLATLPARTYVGFWKKAIRSVTRRG